MSVSIGTCGPVPSLGGDRGGEGRLFERSRVRWTGERTDGTKGEEDGGKDLVRSVQDGAPETRTTGDPSVVGGRKTSQSETTVTGGTPLQRRAGTQGSSSGTVGGRSWKGAIGSTTNEGNTVHPDNQIKQRAVLHRSPVPPSPSWCPGTGRGTIQESLTSHHQRVIYDQLTD